MDWTAEQFMQDIAVRDERIAVLEVALKDARGQMREELGNNRLLTAKLNDIGAVVDEALRSEEGVRIVASKFGQVVADGVLADLRGDAERGAVGCGSGATITLDTLLEYDHAQWRAERRANGGTSLQNFLDVVFDRLASRKATGGEAGREAHRREKLAAGATASIYSFASEHFKWPLGFLVCMQVNLTSGSQEATNLVAASIPGGITHQGLDQWTTRGLEEVTGADGVIGADTRVNSDACAGTDNTGTYDAGNCAIGGEFKRPVITNNLIAHWIEPLARCVQKVAHLGPLCWKWWSRVPTAIVELAKEPYLHEPAGTFTEAQLVENEIDTYVHKQLTVVCEEYATFDPQTRTYSIEFMGEVGAVHNAGASGSGETDEADPNAITEKICTACSESHPYDTATRKGARVCTGCGLALPGVADILRARTLAGGPRVEQFMEPAPKRYFGQAGTRVSTYDHAKGRRVVVSQEASVAPRAPGAGSGSDQYVVIEAAPPDKLNPGYTQNQVYTRDKLMARLKVSGFVPPGEEERFFGFMVSDQGARVRANLEHPNVIPLIGLLHEEMCYARILATIVWTLASNEVVHLLGFDGDGGRKMLKNSTDHHKSVQHLALLRCAMTRAIICEYVIQDDGGAPKTVKVGPGRYCSPRHRHVY